MSVLQCLSAMLNANGKNRNTGVATTGKDTAITFFILGGEVALLYSLSFKSFWLSYSNNGGVRVGDLCSIVIGGGFYSVGVTWTIKALSSWVNTLNKCMSIKDPARYAETVNNRKVASVDDGIVNDYSLLVLVTTSCLLTFASYQLRKHGRALFYSFEEKEE